MIIPVGAVEKKHGGHKGRIKDPRRCNHLLGFFPGHLEAQRIDNGVEAVYADAEENVDLHAWGEVLKVSHSLAHGAAQRPPPGGELQQDEGHAGNADEQIGACHGDHKVVGGGLRPPAPVDDQTNQGIAKDRKQPQGPEENAGCGHFAGFPSILQVCPVARPAMLHVGFCQVPAWQGRRCCSAAAVVDGHQECWNNQRRLAVIHSVSKNHIHFFSLSSR